MCASGNTASTWKLFRALLGYLALCWATAELGTCPGLSDTPAPTFASSADLSTVGSHTSLVCLLQTVLRLHRASSIWGIVKGLLALPAQGPTHLESKIVISLDFSGIVTSQIWEGLGSSLGFVLFAWLGHV